MLYTKKNNDDYNSMAEKVVSYVEKSGYKDIKADFSGYEKPSALKMVNEDITLTPDFTAEKDGNKYYFEIVIKNSKEDEQEKLVSKWKALQTMAEMKGGSLELFIPHGSYKFATDLVKTYSINANLIKMNSI